MVETQEGAAQKQASAPLILIHYWIDIYRAIICMLDSIENTKQKLCAVFNACATKPSLGFLRPRQQLDNFHVILSTAIL